MVDWLKLVDKVDMEGDILSFLLKSVYDVLPSPTNLKTWGLSKSPDRKLCGRPAILEHVLNLCRTALSDGRYRWRHDKVLSSIAVHLDQARRAQKTVSPSLISCVKAGQEVKGAKSASGILGTASNWKLEVDLKNQLNFPDHRDQPENRHGYVVTFNQTSSLGRTELCWKRLQGMVVFSSKGRLQRISIPVTVALF